MTCRSYAQRRRLLAAGYAKGGIMGALKTMPRVGRHLIANPPKPERKLDDAPDIDRR